MVRQHPGSAGLGNTGAGLGNSGVGRFVSTPTS